MSGSHQQCQVNHLACEQPPKLWEWWTTQSQRQNFSNHGPGRWDQDSWAVVGLYHLHALLTREQSLLAGWRLHLQDLHQAETESQKIILRVGLKAAFFYLWINREFMLNCLGACSGVYALKTKALIAIFCGSNVSSARHRWDAPPSPLPTAGHALRKWEQSCEGAGNRRKLLAGLYQYNDIKQSGLCSAMQFLSCSFTLPGVWALCTQPEAFPQGRSWSAQLLGLLPADPWPWEACGPWWEQGSAPPTSWLSSSRANIQPDTEHAICRNTNLLLLKLLDFSLKTNKRMRKRAISRANGTHWFCICDLP